MRGFLVLTGLLIALSGAFLVAWPRLVDTPALRGELARLLREAGGSEVRIDGAVRLELFPMPRVAIDRAVLGDRIEVAPGTRFSADRIDVDLAPLALLGGRIEPLGLQLVRPRLELAGTPISLTEVILRALAVGPMAGVRRIHVVDGDLRLPGHDGPNPPQAFDAIDLTAVRVAGRGFTLEGSAAVADEPLRLTLSGEPLALGEPVAITARLETGPRASPAIAGFTGRLTPGSAGAQAEGKLTVSTERGPLPAWLAGETSFRATAEGRLSAGPTRVEVADLILTLPEGQLRGALALAPSRTLELSLEGARLAVTPDLIDAARRLIAAAQSRHGLSGRATLQLASATWRGDQVRRLRAESAMNPDGRPALERLEAILPGQAALAWTGSPSAPGDLLSGELSLQAGELRPLLAWLGVAAADLPAGGLTSLDLTADAVIGPGSLRLDRLRARMDASRIEGSLVYADTGRPRIDMALTADRLNTALYQASPPEGADWQTRLAALDGSLELRVDELSHDALRGRGFQLRAGLDAGRLDLPEVRVADLAGAGLELRGMVDLPLGAWELTGALTLAEPKPIFWLLGVPPPLEIDRLAPLHLHAQSRQEAGVTSLGLQLDANNAAASLTGQLAGEPADGSLDLSMTAQAADIGELLFALGWPAPPERRAFGSLAATARVQRSTGPIEVALRAEAGDSEIAADAEIATDAARPRLAGTLKAPSLDAALVAAVYETLALPLDFPSGNPWLWPGIWPRQPLGWAWLQAMDLSLGIEIARLFHRGRDLGVAATTATITDGSLALSQLRLPVAGGKLTGFVTLEGKSGYGVLGADIRLARARAEQLAAAAAPGSTLQGSLDLDAALLGQGRSIADLVASLSGSGSLTLREARLPGVAGAAVDVSAPSLPLVTLSGPFRVARGVVESVPPGLAVGLPRESATLGLRLDLLAWLLDARLRSGGSGRRFLGPPGRIGSPPAP